MPLAKNPWTDSKLAQKKLFPHDSKPLGRQYESGMDESVDISRFLVYFQEAFVLEFLLVGSLRSQYHFHSLIIVIELLLDAVEVEVVPDELIVDLAEELVVFQVAEPLDPPAVGLLAVLRLFRHQI